MNSTCSRRKLLGLIGGSLGWLAAQPLARAAKAALKNVFASRKRRRATIPRNTAGDVHRRRSLHRLRAVRRCLQD